MWVYSWRLRDPPKGRTPSELSKHSVVPNSSGFTFHGSADRQRRATLCGVGPCAERSWQGTRRHSAWGDQL